MDRRGVFLHGVRAAGLLTLLLLALGALVLMRGGACWRCDGEGHAFGDNPFVPCSGCEGTGMARDALFLSRTVPCGSGPPEPWRLVVRRRGEDLLVCNPILIPVCFWICAGLSVAGGLFLGLRAGRCPLCLGEGRLVLEITPPQRSASLRECPCAACEGRGRLTALDRWLAGV